MPKFDPSKPRGEVTFQCRACKRTFDAPPARVVDDADPAAEHHPFKYFAACPGCKEEVPQAPWDRALQKAWLNATGPKTAEGKAEVTKNLEGHPTPEETLRTRFNGMKNGLHAKTATYFPAKPDGYSFCKQCEVNREWCAVQPACAKKTEIFLLHHAAFDKKDPKVLQSLYGDLQAAIFAVLQQILQTIIADGVTIKSPKFMSHDGVSITCTYMDYTDLDENRNPTVKNVIELQKHPLFTPLGELLSRNNLSLADMGMTTKVIDQQVDDEMGRLTDKGSAPEQLEDFRRRQEAALGAIAEKVERGHAARDRDPVLLEHNAESGEATLVPPA